MSVNSRYHSVNIRSATEEDIERVIEIDRLSFSDPWCYNFYKSSLKDIFLIIEKGGEICGYLVACVCHDLKKAVVIRVAVHPDHRGEGFGRSLMRRCLEIIVARDIEVVELDVELVSRAAIRLYEKFGFKIENIIVFPSDYPGDEETFYVMRLRLPKPNDSISQVN